MISDIAILKVTLTNKTDIRHSSVTFGTFGHCVLDVAPVQYVQLTRHSSAPSIARHRANPLPELTKTTASQNTSDTAL